MKKKQKANKLLDLGQLDLKMTKLRILLSFSFLIISLLLISSGNTIVSIIGVILLIITFLGIKTGTYIWDWIFWKRVFK